MAGLVPAWMPGRLFWAYFVGVAFLAAAVGILVELLARPAATMLGVMFFLFVVLLHIPRIVLHAHDGNEWTSGFVALAMCGGAWVLASASPLYERETADPFLKFGQYIFAMAFVAFGIQHFVYARLAVGLGPPWLARFAAALLGTILFLFFLLLHIPRISGHLHDPGPWTSGFEVLALGADALVLASTLARQDRE